MNILFTGLTGLVGSHLANLIHRDLVKDGIFREINFLQYIEVKKIIIYLYHLTQFVIVILPVIVEI